MKNSNDTIGNRTRDLPACRAVPQPTASPRAPSWFVLFIKFYQNAQGRGTYPTWEEKQIRITLELNLIERTVDWHGTWIVGTFTSIC